MYSRGTTFWSYYKRYGFRVYIRYHPTLRLTFHHCVLRLNLIKNMLNTCIYTHTHTQTHTYPSIKYKEPNHTYTNPSMLLSYISYPRQHIGIARSKQTCECIYTSRRTQPNKHVYLHHQGKIIFKDACLCECMTYLTYLVASQHLWHKCVNMWMRVHGIKTKKHKINPNLIIWKTKKQQT